MQAWDTSIGAGSQFGTGATHFDGTISLLVNDEGRGICAVTASHIVARTGSTPLLDRAGWPIGIPDRPPTEEDLFGLVVLDRQTYVFSGLRSGADPRPVRAPEEVLGCRVWKLSGGSCEAGTVTCVRSLCYFAVPGRPGPPRLIEDVFEIQPNDPERFGTPADGGSPVIDDHGNPIGMILAAGGGRYFAAPFDPWLRGKGLAPLGASQAKRHNDAIRIEVFDDVMKRPSTLAAPDDVAIDVRQRLRTAIRQPLKVSQEPQSEVARVLAGAL